MQGVVKLLQGMQLHPIVDHFSIALLTVAILIDLVGGVFPARPWLRSSALTLMVLGALAAAGSFWTGDAEADRLWDMMSPQAKEYFMGGSTKFLGHGRLGYYLMIVFGVLALWRILTALFGFMAETRAPYLVAAVISLGFLTYQGHTGGTLVYRYGVGTGPMAAGAAELPAPLPQTAPTPIPTVYVPLPTPTPPATAPSAAASGAGMPGPLPTAPAASGTPAML